MESGWFGRAWRTGACWRRGPGFPDDSSDTERKVRVGDDDVLDVLMIASTVGFFAACLAYMVGCERLREGEQS